MILAVDVHYNSIGIRVGAALCEFWNSTVHRGFSEHILGVEEVHDYTPGELYKRELPFLLKIVTPSCYQRGMENYIQDHYVFDIPSPEFIAQRDRDWKRKSDLIDARDSFIVRAISLCENTRARPNNEWDRRLREAYNAYKKEEKR